MSGLSIQRSREDRGTEALVSGHQRVRLPQGRSPGAIIFNQTDNLDQPEEVDVVNGVELLDSLPRAAYKGLRRKSDVFVSSPSRIYRGDLKVIADSYRFPSGHQMLVLAVANMAAYPTSSFVAISRYHLILIPSLYGQLFTLYLSFRRNGLPSPSDNVIRYCFTLKRCPLPRDSTEHFLYDGMYYQGVWAGKYRELL
ncbi:hypothetical protein ACOSQ2_013451 [Xanthoceras sorbifolium]